jgi:methylaspartate mutase epsilon subunit
MEIQVEIMNKRWTKKHFMEIRKEVLQMWPTGKEVDLEEGIQYQRTLPQSKNAVAKFTQAKIEGKTLTQPRAGVAVLDECIALLKYLQDEGKADLVPTSSDSYTRDLRFGEAQKAIEESIRQGRSMLNGFPLINHGVKNCRKLTEALEVPVVARIGPPPDPRLGSEIGLASGYTDYFGGPLLMILAYTKDIPFEKVIENWQYTYWLIGHYEENGIQINNESQAVLTGTLVPPSLSIVCLIIEGLIGAEQGVKHFARGLCQGGSLWQDVAALRVFPELWEEYMGRFGYQDLHMVTELNQFMGAFPENPGDACGLIALGAMAAAFGHATQVITKSTEEALGLPSKEANAMGLRVTKQVLEMVRKQTHFENHAIVEEMEIIRSEVHCILDKILELGENDVTRGTLSALKLGILDAPFSPRRESSSNIIPVRDGEGNIRILNPGLLPLDQKIIDFHRRKIEARGQKEGRKPSYEMTIHDILSVSQGGL